MRKITLIINSPVTISTKAGVIKIDTDINIVKVLNTSGKPLTVNPDPEEITIKEDGTFEMSGSGIWKNE